jgi:D-alanine transaminase
MDELIWLNGKVMPLAEARVGVEDRGFQFADGVYEVIRIYNGKTFSLPEHLRRLARSCAGIGLKMPLPEAELAQQINALATRSGLKDAMVYVQATRGCCRRNHVYPDCDPTLLFYCRQLEPVAAPGTSQGAKLQSVPDERWKRCWIKSIALLANVMAKNAAIAAGADEAVFVEDGFISECSASNILIVSRGTLITAPVGPKVLPGITRQILLDLASDMGIAAIERPFSEGEALAADELFITSTTREISWVSHWNGMRICGECGPIALQLHRDLRRRINEETA